MKTWDNYLAWERGENPPAYLNQPEAGYFREPHKDRFNGRYTYTPIIYFPDETNERLVGRRGAWPNGAELSEEEVIEKWNNGLHAHRVKQQEYRQVAAEGGLWSDESPSAPLQGHNQPPEPESFEELKAAVEDAEHEANGYLEGLPIADQAEADKISNVAHRLAELHKLINDKRKEEKQPYVDGGDAVERKWKPLIAAAVTFRLLKSRLITPWQVKEKYRLKKEAEAARAAGEAVEDKKPRSGTRGRAIGLKTFRRAEITDYKLCLEFFADRDEVREAVQTLADRAVQHDSGVVIPGVRTVEEDRAV